MPRKQVLLILRGMRKQLRRADPAARAWLWRKWYAHLMHAHAVGVLSAEGAAWLAIRENVFAKSWGLPLPKGTTVWFSDFVWRG